MTRRAGGEVYLCRSVMRASFREECYLVLSTHSTGRWRTGGLYRTRVQTYSVCRSLLRDTRSFELFMTVPRLDEVVFFGTFERQNCFDRKFELHHAPRGPQFAHFLDVFCLSMPQQNHFSGNNLHIIIEEHFSQVSKEYF